MTIDDLLRRRDHRLLQIDDQDRLPQPAGADRIGGLSDDNPFKMALEKVDNAQTEASNQIEAFVAGEQESLHEVMIATNQAKLQFQMLVEVRNKIMESYQELIRMQV